MSGFLEMCNIVSAYCTDKRFREKVFKFKKYPRKKEQGVDYCIYLYKRFIKYIEAYHKETYQKLEFEEKIKLRDEIFFPSALKEFEKTYDMLEERFKRWYQCHPENTRKKKENGRKYNKNENSEQVRHKGKMGRKQSRS